MLYSRVAGRLYVVYVIELKKPPLRVPKYYVGMSGHCIRRWRQHKDPLKHSANAIAYYGAKRVVYVEVCRDKSHALKRESALRRQAMRLDWEPRDGLCCYIPLENLDPKEVRGRLSS